MQIEIDIEGENLADTEIIKIETGSDGHAVVAAISEKCGIKAAELLLFEEDGAEPLDLIVIFDEHRAGKVHHVHRAREIEVTVFYLDHEAKRHFPPSARAQKVLEWAVAVKEFGIDEPIRPEMELALHGSKEELPKRAHIGRYVKHPHHKLELDLIRGIVPNGGL